MFGHRYATTRHAAWFKRAGGIARLVFHPHVRFDLQQRREAFDQRYFIAGQERQQLTIAPQAGLASPGPVTKVSPKKGRSRPVAASHTRDRQSAVGAGRAPSRRRNSECQRESARV